MNTYQMTVIVMLALVAILFATASRHLLARVWRAIKFTGALLANDNPLTVGEHEEGRLTYFCDSAPMTTRFLLVKQGVLGLGDNHCTLITSIADIPLGVCYDEPAATTDPVTVRLLQSAGQTLRMVAASAIAAGSFVVTDGTGKVQQLPAVAGVYWCVGLAVTTAVLSGDLVEVDPDRGQIGVSFVT